MWLGNGPRNGGVLETGKRRTSHPTFFFELHRGCGGYFGLARSASARSAPLDCIGVVGVILARPALARSAPLRRVVQTPLVLCNLRSPVVQTPVSPMQSEGSARPNPHNPYAIQGGRGCAARHTPPRSVRMNAFSPALCGKI